MTIPFHPKQHFHFIGIGGIGMSALALILVKRSYSVSGSDRKKTNVISNLCSEGVVFFQNQDAENINTICQNKSLPVVVISTAIPKNNPELQAAQKANLDILHRSDLLAALINQQNSIAVAGSHGKTTTSTILATLLALAGEDPTAIIGGVVPFYQSNGHAGLGKLLVAEADESDGTLVKFQAEIGVITNLELDHTDHYCDIDDLTKTMKKFGSKCQKVLANYDSSILRKHFKEAIWWSIKNKKDADFAALPLVMDGDQTIADIYENNQLLGQINLPMPGLHNLSNTIAAIAACRITGVPFNKLQMGIPFIKSPKRRFEFLGIWEGRQIIDDYAHHPSEVEATLNMAKLIINNNKATSPKRVLVGFQPHRYSRTKEFLKEFAHSLAKADCILLAPIYGAGEIPINDLSSESLANCIKSINPKIPIAVAQNLDELTILIKKYSLKNDLVITMGAGDITDLWKRLHKPSKKALWNSNLAA